MNTHHDTSSGLHRWRRRLSTTRQALVWMAPTDGRAVSDIPQAFDDWAALHEGAAVEVWLPSPTLLTWADPEAPDAQALRERAIERWVHYLDLQAEDFDSAWRVQTSLDLGSSRVALACAAPCALIEGLQAVAQGRGVALRAIQPWWARPLMQAHLGLPAAAQAQAPRWWVGREGPWQMQACWAVESGEWVLRSLSSVVADAMEPVEAMDQVDAPSATGVGGEALRASARNRADGAEALNFIGPRVPASFWSWALLALSAIAVVHAVDLHQQLVVSEEATQAEWARLQAHAREPNAALAGSGVGGDAPAAPDAPPPLQADGWRAAAQLAASLAHPWADALDHIDASAHRRGVALTRFQLDLSTWGAQAAQAAQALPWRLQAAVPDDATALAWLQDLGPQAMLQRRDALPQPVQSDRHTLSWRIDVGVGGDQAGGPP